MASLAELFRQNALLSKMDPRDTANALLTAQSEAVAGVGSNFLPGAGDLVGLAQDANMYWSDPSSRRMRNYLMTGLGALPFIPALASMGKATRNVPTGLGNEAGMVRVPKRFYRGIGPEGATAGTAMLGKGLYSSPYKWKAGLYARDAKTGKKTGRIMELTAEEAMPKNPLVLEGKGRGGSVGVFTDWVLEQSGFKNMRDFHARWPDPGEFVKSKGFDGVWIDDEIVKY